MKLEHVTLGLELGAGFLVLCVCTLFFVDAQLNTIKRRLQQEGVSGNTLNVITGIQHVFNALFKTILGILLVILHILGYIFYTKMHT